MSEPVRVILADDHAMVREALASLLEASGAVRVVDQLSTTASVAEALAAHRPDVLVCDISMPGGGALKLLEGLGDDAAPVVVLTVHDSLHYAVRALELGAAGYVLKSAPVDELLEAVTLARDGDVYVSRSISQRVLKRLRTPQHRRTGLDALSPREFDVLRVLGSGATVADAAKHLHISASTVSTYRARILEKLGLQNTAELIRLALEHDLVG